ncbi:hypothetical protein B0H17DRAFT_1219867 [Mycena rosella]|uniref:Uncharacterized protein n=1 Tax=Mycena rosella TaxID=1033263 RepID=A0AAD7BEK1_MYCRO|nr:hypothetical protein B0H17DRAFT_1219867 [Mycena rosella]
MVAPWAHPSTARRPVEELDHKAVGVADDPRLEPYQTPESAEYCAEWVPAPDTYLLFFLSRGPVSGNLNIVEKLPRGSKGPIEVKVTTQYHDTADLERIKAVRWGRQWSAGCSSGLNHGICTPLPKATIRGDFAGFFDSNEFKVIRLKSLDAPIAHNLLVARSLSIQTRNAPVESSFWGSALSVHTSNAPIFSFAFLWGETKGDDTRLRLETSNGHVFLVMPSPEAEVHTSAAPLDLCLVKAYEDPVVVLHASTTSAPVTISTSSAQVEVDVKMDSVDPTGQGRQRFHKALSTGEHAQGDIYYDGESTEGRGRGSIQITTSEYPINFQC